MIFPPYLYFLLFNLIYFVFISSLPRSCPVSLPPFHSGPGRPRFLNCREAASAGHRALPSPPSAWVLRGPACLSLFLLLFVLLPLVNKATRYTAGLVRDYRHDKAKSWGIPWDEWSPGKGSPWARSPVWGSGPGKSRGRHLHCWVSIFSFLPQE